MKNVPARITEARPTLAISLWELPSASSSKPKLDRPTEGLMGDSSEFASGTWGITGCISITVVF
jgi:hypothetical protein